MELMWIDCGHPLYQSERKLRFELLYVPLGYLELPQLPGEGGFLHLVAVQDGVVIGCVLVSHEGDSGRVCQLAVAMGHQARGLGRRLLQKLEERLSQDGLKSVCKDVRLPLVEFFEKLGYRSDSAVFQKDGLNHLRMKKDL